MPSPLRNDDDAGKGAVEQDRPEQNHNVATNELMQCDDDRVVRAHVTDYPEPGKSPEHSGEIFMDPKSREKIKQQEKSKNEDNREDIKNPEGRKQDQDPGHRQKENQNESKDDPLAA